MESLKIAGRILTSSSGDVFKEALKRNSPVSMLRAKYIVQPEVYEDIPLALSYAASHSPTLEIAVKGGGAHSSTWASSQDGIVIDLSMLNAVKVAADKESVTIQGGALWGDVYQECKKEGVDVVGAPLWFVDVGGFLLGGGYGPLSGQHGLAIDNMLSATVVLADRRIVQTSTQTEPDLFWAIRGGGGQFGILVEVILKAFPQAGPFAVGALSFKRSYTAKEKINITFTRPPPLFKPAILIMPWISEDVDNRSEKVLPPFRSELPQPLADKIATVPNMLVVSHGADATLAVAPKRLTIRGTLISDLSEEMLIGAFKRWVNFTEENEDACGSVILWDLTRADKVSSVPPEATAANVRSKYYWMAVQGRSHSAASDDIVCSFVASTVSYVRETNARLASTDLGDFLNLGQGDEQVGDVFGHNLPRLRKLKAKYDPNMVFKKGIAVQPDFE